MIDFVIFWAAQLLGFILALSLLIVLMVLGAVLWLNAVKSGRMKVRGMK